MAGMQTGLPFGMTGFGTPSMGGFGGMGGYGQMMGGYDAMGFGGGGFGANVMGGYGVGGMGSMGSMESQQTSSMMNQMMTMMGMVIQMLMLKQMQTMMSSMAQFGGGAASGGTPGLGNFLGSGDSGSGGGAAATGGTSGASGASEASTPGTSAPDGSGEKAAEIARSYLGQKSGEINNMANFSHAGGMDNNCADFVSACLANAGLYKKKSGDASVRILKQHLKEDGWKTVSKAQAKPGDVAIFNGTQHVELVTKAGGTELIGSNNKGGGNVQYVGTDSGNWGQVEYLSKG